MQQWIRALVVAASVLVGTLSMMVVTVIARPAQSDLLAAWSFQVEQELPDSISLDMLASQEVAAAWPGSDLVDVLLERVPLDPGDKLNGRDPDESGGGPTLGYVAQSSGMHLLYVETEEIAVATADGASRFLQGESAFVPQLTAADLAEWREGGAWPSYDLRNDSDECASVLRLSVYFSPPGRGAVPSAPSGPERGCDEYQFLFYSIGTFPWPADPPGEVLVRLFLARVSWEQPAYMANELFEYPTSITLLVESGELNFGVRGAGGVLPPGGQFTIAPDVSFNAGGPKGTTVLALGVVPAEQEWFVVPPRRDSRDGPVTAHAFQPGTVVITAEERVRLRAAPTTDSAIVVELPRGSELTVTGPPTPDPGGDFDWYPVAAKDGRTGYVAGSFLALPQA